jgi:hypothetical protein
MVDTNNDGRVSEQKFLEGCRNGLVQKQANKAGECGGGETPEKPTQQ